MEKLELYSNMSMMVLAGSETSATLLSGLVFHLLSNPEIYEKLTKEVRSAFSDTSDMTFRNEADLPYLNACIEEALRIYPPVPMSIPRRTPPEGATIAGRFIPGNVLPTPRRLIRRESC
jgi:cytochrome P450